MKNHLNTLIDFLNHLEQSSIHYRLEKNTEETIMVLIAVPGERWEVEFSNNGEVMIEIFHSSGEIMDQSHLKNLFQKFSD